MSQIDIIDELKGIAQYLGDNDMTTCLRVVNRAIKEIQDGRDYTVEEVNRINAELQKTLNAGAVWEGAYREAEQENAKLRSHCEDYDRHVGRVQILSDDLQDTKEELTMARSANDALKVLHERQITTLRQEFQVLSDGVNRRCGADSNQLPLVSLDRVLAEQRQENAKLREALKDEPCAVCGMRSRDMLGDDKCVACERDDALYHIQRWAEGTQVCGSHRSCQCAICETLYRKAERLREAKGASGE